MMIQAVSSDTRAFGIRWLLVGVLAIGVLALQAGRGTLAYFTSSTTSPANTFTAGTLDVTSSTLGGSGFGWATSGFTGSNCSTLLSVASLISTQGWAPSYFCNTAVTLTNSGNLDAYMRLRLVKTGGTTTADGSLNQAMIFYMSQYSTTAARDADCGTGKLGYAPNGSTNAAQIPDVAGTRTAITALGTSGKALGATQLTSGAAGLGLTANNASVPPADPMTASSFTDLLGNDTVDGSAGSVTLAAGASQYYCAAIFFPSDSGLTAANGAGDNQAQGGTDTYYLHLLAAQKSGR